MQTFFAGKLRLKPLYVTDQPANRPEIMARLLSPGGELAVLNDGVSAVRHLGAVELLSGKARGNHYHKLRHESFYIVTGELVLHALDNRTGERITTRMQKGDLALIDPEIVHTYLPSSDGFAIEFAPEVFDAADVYRVVLV